MLGSIALVLLCGMLLGGIFEKLKLPSLVGMMITGMLLGPHVFHLLHADLLQISADLRQMALIIILTRAGLSLDIRDLKKVGRPAILMCFVPAVFEMVGVLLLAPVFLKISYVEALVMGSVLAAVSPAVIVPRMLKIMEEGYGKEKKIPQMILAGASVDDVFVIVVFTVALTFAKSGEVKLMHFIEIPVSVFTGVIVGVIFGFVFVFLFRYIHMRDSAKLLLLLSISFLLVVLQDKLENIVPFSALLSIMAMGICMKAKNEELSVRLSGKYNKLWVGAEIILFVLVGATVDIQYALSAGPMVIVVILFALLVRMLGVFVSVSGKQLNAKETVFCMVAYTPKATVQAAIGATPLAMGLACGNIVLTASVVAIMVTAPLGAFFIDRFYQKMLE